jgi:hypothetical protein
MSQNSRQAKNNGGRFFSQHKMPLSKYRKCRPSKMLRGLFEAFIGKLCLSLSKENFAISQVSKVGSTLLLLVEGVSGLLLCNKKNKVFFSLQHSQNWQVSQWLYFYINMLSNPED